MNPISKDEKEIMDLLKKFQEGYSKRDLTNLDVYFSELFIQSDSLVILGTSDGEWCLGVDASKKLIEDDWKHWGDVCINTDAIDLSINDHIAWFSTTGTVSQNFKLSDATYDAFLGYVKEYLCEPTCWLGELSNESKLTTISWELTHLLSGEGEKYNWDFRLTGIMTKEHENWRIAQLQFSMPTTSRYPDERIIGNNVYGISHEKATEKLKAFNKTKKELLEIKTLLKSFNEDFMNRSTPSDRLVDQYFSTDGQSKLLGTGLDKYLSSDEMSRAFDLYRNQWDNLNISVDEAIISEKNTVAWVQTLGIAKAYIPKQKAIEIELEKATEITNSSLSSKEKLFRINRNIITMINESSKGEDYEWPIRFEAVLVKENNQWLFHFLHFSYPTNIILEGKTDASTKCL